MPKHRLALLKYALPVLLAAADVASLSAQPVPSGMRVRVTAPEYRPRPLVAHVVESGGPLIVREGNGTVHTIPIEQVTLIETAAGRARARGALAGVLIGGVAGTVAGAISGSSDRCPEGPCLTDGKDPDSMDLAGGAVLGVLAGGLIGTLLAPERWVRQWPVGLTWSGQGMAAGVRVLRH